MKPTLLLFHAENLNENRDSVCHLIFVPVIDGIRQPVKEYFVNPEAEFYLVMSGITEEDVASYPRYDAIWPEIQQLFDQFDIAVCTGSGYSARALCNTLNRLGIPMVPTRYCNAKSILRRSMKELSYSYDFLSWTYFDDCPDAEDPVGIANRWCDLILMALENDSNDSLNLFLKSARIHVGQLSHDDFIPSLSAHKPNKNTYKPLDTSAIVVEAQPDNPFYERTVVFTGKLSTLTRKDARSMVIKIGGYSPESLTKDTDYLVVGTQDLRVVGEQGLSGKMKTAAKYQEQGLPIEIIDENDFLEMMQS